jgi:hypothetical protein
MIAPVTTIFSLLQAAAPAIMQGITENLVSAFDLYVSENQVDLTSMNANCVQCPWCNKHIKISQQF